jgi:tRNA/tmRNA/rRNA uracil-C5-methylase (TrmA/RlmC/RlmD family)
MSNHQEDFIQILNKAIFENTFVKLSLANYKGSIVDLKNIYVKRIIIKEENKLSFTYRYRTNDIVKNYTIEEGISIITEFLTQGAFRLATVFTIKVDTIFELINDRKTSLREVKPTHTQLPSLDHNVEKKRLLKPDGKLYLHQLNITDEKGHVYKHAQDKFKQINHYVELLSPLIKNLPKHELLQVVDMGAGKGYLTFALYDYLINTLNLPAKVIGVEFRKDLVSLCNDIATKSLFKQLEFIEGSIEQYENSTIHVLIALHACDTATDDAIFKGINANADLIVVAPCCHKQIRKQIEIHKTKNELDFLLKYGIFLERQAEMVTDGIRALILEYFGYSTKVVEFVSDSNTPKNVMIVAEKKSKTESQKIDILARIKETKQYFGIDFHHLEKRLGLDI